MPLIHRSQMGPPRVLFVQPSVQPPGGGNGVAAWMVQALHLQYDLTVITLEPFEVGPINRFYGTNIDVARVKTITCLPRVYPWIEKIPLRLALLKSSLLLRIVSKAQAEYDLLISANNEANLHQPGIQYIHYPFNVRPRPAVDLRGYHYRFLVRPYYAICDRIALFQREGVMRNLSLVNSDWTAQVMSRWYDSLPTITLYPPVAGDFPEVPWGERANGFVCIGRIAPEKDLDRVFEILIAVRRRFPDVRLHLIGTPGFDRHYTRRILARAERERAWVTVHQDISRAELIRIVSGHRFGIHTMAEEHFGTAVAEMVQAGCVVWVPNGGGQVESVGADDRFLYANNADAIEKISSALADEDYSARLRAELARHRSRSTPDQFVSRFLQIVDNFIASTCDEPA